MHTQRQKQEHGKSILLDGNGIFDYIVTKNLIEEII